MILRVARVNYKTDYSGTPTSWERYALREVEHILRIVLLLPRLEGIEIGGVVSRERHVPIDIVLIRFRGGILVDGCPIVINERGVLGGLVCIAAPIGHHLNAIERVTMDECRRASCHFVDSRLGAVEVVNEVGVVIGIRTHGINHGRDTCV